MADLICTNITFAFQYIEKHGDTIFTVFVR